MAVTCVDWELSVERGPGWLIVKPTPEGPQAVQTGEFAAAIWSLLEQQFTYRVVLELDRIDLLTSHLIGQLILLQKRVHTHDGVLRLCGLNAAAQQSLKISHLQTHLPCFDTREAAILGTRPPQPR